MGVLEIAMEAIFQQLNTDLQNTILSSIEELAPTIVLIVGIPIVLGMFISIFTGGRNDYDQDWIDDYEHSQIGYDGRGGWDDDYDPY